MRTAREIIKEKEIIVPVVMQQLKQFQFESEKIFRP